MQRTHAPARHLEFFLRPSTQLSMTPLLTNKRPGGQGDGLTDRSRWSKISEQMDTPNDKSKRLVQEAAR